MTHNNDGISLPDVSPRGSSYGRVSPFEDQSEDGQEEHAAKQNTVHESDGETEEGMISLHDAIE